MEKLFFCIFLVILIAVPHSGVEAATFYGEITRGYQYVEKRGSGYGVYVPASFDPNKRNTLVFAFGRSQKDLALSKDQLGEYAGLWADEAERRGVVVVVPYWEPIIIEEGQHTEEFYLDILEEVMRIYNIDPHKVLIAGFGLGSAAAFSLAALYPDKFNGVVTIAFSPLRELVTRDLMAVRLVGGIPPRKLPPILMVCGENDGEVPLPWVQEDKVALESKGNRVELKIIPQMGHTHAPQINGLILDWFESVN